MKAREGYQQGDVLIVRTGSIPGDAKPVQPGVRGFVLAEGEHTGHAHVIEKTEDVELFERGDTLYMRVKVEVTLTHEEHLAQTIAPGTYQVGCVVEVDPFEDEVRRVAD